VLSVENVASAYGRIEVLHGVSMEVRVGEIVAIVGANGAGKTTLLRAISGVQPITAGRIFFSGKPIETLPAHVRVALGIVQVPEGRQLFAPLSVEDNLKLGTCSRRAVDLGSELARVTTTKVVNGATVSAAEFADRCR
jgi:branched-chain amino acid transport system ATP-binding protein